MATRRSGRYTPRRAQHQLQRSAHDGAEVRLWMQARVTRSSTQPSPPLHGHTRFRHPAHVKRARDLHRTTPCVDGRALYLLANLLSDMRSRLMARAPDRQRRELDAPR